MSQRQGIHRSSTTPTNCDVDKSTLIVVPTLNEEQLIGDCIESLLHQDVDDDLKIVIVDGGSCDRTLEIVRSYASKYPHLDLVANPNKTQAHGLNKVARSLAATTDDAYMIRADAHCVYPSNFVRELLLAARSTAAEAVVVSMTTVGGNLWQNAISHAFRSILAHGGALHRAGTAVGWREVDHGHHALLDLRTFVGLDGYDTDLPVNEDFDYDHRLAGVGGRIVLAGGVELQYAPRQTPVALATQYFRYGKGRRATDAKHHRRPALRQAAPIGITLVNVLSILLALVTMRPEFSVVVPAYFLVLLVASMQARWDAPMSEKILAPFVLAIMHNSFGLGYLWALVRGQSRRRARPAYFGVLNDADTVRRS